MKISVGFTGLLAIAFIVLKLCNVINWGWIWVLSPIWLPAIIAFITVFAVVFAKIESGRKMPKPTKSKWQQRMEEVQERNRKNRFI